MRWEGRVVHEKVNIFIFYSLFHFIATLDHLDLEDSVDVLSIRRVD